jgi:hypothetical protein
MASGATALCYCVETRQLFIGVENGTVSVRTYMFYQTYCVVLKIYLLLYVIKQISLLNVVSCERMGVTAICFCLFVLHSIDLGHRNSQNAIYTQHNHNNTCPLQYPKEQNQSKLAINKIIKYNSVT